MRETVTLDGLVPAVPSRPSHRLAGFLVWLLIGCIAVVVAIPALAISLVVATLVVAIRPIQALFRTR